MSTPSIESTRRRFLGLALGTGAAAGLLVSGSASAVPAEPEPKKKEEEEVAPGEDLMREHGVLKRVLLVYGEAIRRIDVRADLPPEPIADAARIIHDFIEEYHEKLEEDQLFPRFRKANRLVELVDVLDQQHRAGRKVTAEISRLATAKALRDPDQSRRLRTAMDQFIRMYAPHEAREDTVLFPAFRELVPGHEYDALGEEFEKKEHQLLGEDGFERMVDRVASIEKTLGIYDLSQFTPRV
jgi:hemerythrin-like domain-containing protein